MTTHLPVHVLPSHHPRDPRLGVTCPRETGWTRSGYGRGRVHENGGRRRLDEFEGRHPRNPQESRDRTYTELEVGQRKSRRCRRAPGLLEVYGHDGTDMGTSKKNRLEVWTHTQTCRTWVEGCDEESWTY